MNISRYQLDVAVYGIRQAVELCRLHGIRLRPELSDVLQQLDDLLAMFADEPESDGDTAELDLIGC